MPGLDELLAMTPRLRALQIARLTRDPEALQDLSLEGGGGAPMGLLSRLGRLLDTPGRWIRSGLTGVEDATGRDVLQKLGVVGSYNEPGLDWGAVAGFGAGEL